MIRKQRSLALPSGTHLPAHAISSSTTNLPVPDTSLGVDFHTDQPLLQQPEQQQLPFKNQHQQRRQSLPPPPMKKRGQKRSLSTLGRDEEISSFSALSSLAAASAMVQQQSDMSRTKRLNHFLLDHKPFTPPKTPLTLPQGPLQVPESKMRAFPPAAGVWPTLKASTDPSERTMPYESLSVASSVVDIPSEALQALNGDEPGGVSASNPADGLQRKPISSFATFEPALALRSDRPPSFLGRRRPLPAAKRPVASTVTSSEGHDSARPLKRVRSSMPPLLKEDLQLAESRLILFGEQEAPSSHLDATFGVASPALFLSNSPPSLSRQTPPRSLSAGDNIKQRRRSWFLNDKVTRPIELGASAHRRASIQAFLNATSPELKSSPLAAQQGAVQEEMRSPFLAHVSDTAGLLGHFESSLASSAVNEDEKRSSSPSALGRSTLSHSHHLQPHQQLQLHVQFQQQQQQSQLQEDDEDEECVIEMESNNFLGNPDFGIFEPTSPTGTMSDDMSSPSGGGSCYKCHFPSCDKVFERYHNLKSHVRTHSGDRPFVCSTCSMRFSRNHDLKRYL